MHVHAPALEVLSVYCNGKKNQKKKNNNNRALGGTPDYIARQLIAVIFSTLAFL